MQLMRILQACGSNTAQLVIREAFRVDDAPTLPRSLLRKRRFTAHRRIGTAAPMRKNHSMDRYIDPEENSFVGPMRPQKTAFVAYPRASGQVNCRFRISENHSKRAINGVY